MTKRFFNDKHEAILRTRVNPILSENPNVKEGETINHQTVVDDARIYIPVYSNEGVLIHHIEYNLHRDLILDLAKQINEIEKEVVALPYRNLPF